MWRNIFMQRKKKFWNFLIPPPPISTLWGAHYSALNQLVHPLFVQSPTITQPQIAQYELFQTFDPGLTKSWNLLCCQQESFGVTSSGWMLRHDRGWELRSWDAQFKSKVNNPLTPPPHYLEFQSKINRPTPASPATACSLWGMMTD